MYNEIRQGYVSYTTHIATAVAARDDMARELKSWDAVFKAIDERRPTVAQLSGTTPMLMTINEYVGIYHAFVKLLSVTEARVDIVNQMRSELADMLNQELELTPELTYATVDKKLDELLWQTTVTEEEHGTVRSTHIPGVGTLVLMSPKKSDDDDKGDDKGGARA
tara:strand:- start:432 stop:926 length:495 start_codon:yes stop_codon:yes gene_type:complete